MSGFNEGRAFVKGVIGDIGACTPILPCGDSWRQRADSEDITVNESCDDCYAANKLKSAKAGVIGANMANSFGDRAGLDFQCETYSHEAWLSVLSSDAAKYHLGRFRIVSDIGYALKCAREASSYNVLMLSRNAKLSRATVLRIEGSDCKTGDGAKSADGPSLAKVQQYMLGLPKKAWTLKLRLTPLVDYGLGDTVFSYDVTQDPREFTAALVRGLRQAAGLSQAGLAQRMRMSRLVAQTPEADVSAFSSPPPAAAPMISRIENGEQERGARIGTLYSIAFACGFSLSISLDDGIVGTKVQVT